MRPLPDKTVFRACYLQPKSSILPTDIPPSILAQLSLPTLTRLESLSHDHLGPSQQFERHSQMIMLAVVRGEDGPEVREIRTEDAGRAATLSGVVRWYTGHGRGAQNGYGRE